MEKNLNHNITGKYIIGYHISYEIYHEGFHKLIFIYFILLFF